MTNGGPFWRWSLSHYSKEGVEPILLQLQDQFELDVTMLLWCGWCAERYRPIPFAVMGPTAKSLGAWSQDIIKPLRAARRALKTPPAPHVLSAARLRDDVKLAELAAEKIAHEMLQLAAEKNLALSAAPDNVETRKRFRDNLAIYTTRAAPAPPPADGLTALLDLLAARIWGDESAASSDGDANG